MIDWRMANAVGRAVAGTAPAAESGAVAGEIRDFADRSAELVAGYTRLVPAHALPAPETVDRDAWLAVNLGSIRSVLDPVAARLGSRMGPLAGPARAAGGAVLAVEVGAMSGYLAGRVLGQYEFPVLDPDAPARLLFVGPNLAHLARTLEADETGLLRWVALHETTHALQFTGVPWLRAHLAERVGELVASLDAVLGARGMLRVPAADDVRALVEAVRRGDLLSLVVGAERRAVLEEVQALMALIEGHAEHVMDAVGAELLPGLPGLRAAMDRRRRERSGLLRVLEKLIGLEMKMRQYEIGKRFCDAVVARGGIEALNRAWDSPATLPRPSELEEPDAWIARVA